VYLTRGGSVQRPVTSGWPAGQTPWPVGPTLQPLTGWLRGDTFQEVVEGNPKLKVGGGRTPWLAAHHLACYRLNQVGNPSLDINTPYLWKSKQDTLLVILHLYRFGLVVVAQVKPCRESSQVFAQAPEVALEIGELLYLYISL
jgi:hypothetical protein